MADDADLVEQQAAMLARIIANDTWPQSLARFAAYSLLLFYNRLLPRILHYAPVWGDDACGLAIDLVSLKPGTSTDVLWAKYMSATRDTLPGVVSLFLSLACGDVVIAHDFWASNFGLHYVPLCAALCAEASQLGQLDAFERVLRVRR